MKRIYIALMIGCMLTACKKTEVEFTYSPNTPRAGQVVTFTNLSTSGEEWKWTFGDGSGATIKYPTHTYKKPGKYVVTLQVDNKANLTVAKEITIMDSVPTFVCADSTFYIFSDYTFTAQVYNPYNYEVRYEWLLPQNAHTEQSLTGSSLTLYFSQPAEQAQLGLRVILNTDTTLIEKLLPVYDKATKSLLMRTGDADYRQRVFANRAEEKFEDPTAAWLLDLEQDTMQTYNGKEFRLSELKATFPPIAGFHIAHRKIYFRVGDEDADNRGLWVANIDGANIVRIDSASCPAMTLDTESNRIYWVSDNDILYMPFIGSDNNQFVTIPQCINHDGAACTKLAIDYEIQ